jgi:diguanylate cyclase (GGDEF)-like protein
VTFVVIAASTAFLIDIFALSSTHVGLHTTWAQFVEFLVIMAVFATLGRFSAESLMGSLGAANRASMIDPVTGLYNRRGFNFHTAQQIKTHKGSVGTLVLADLDHFRRVNVVIGHGAGDMVLQEFARRLAQAAEGHVLARIGDESSRSSCRASHRRWSAAVRHKLHGACSSSSRASRCVRRWAGACYPRDSSSVESLLLAAENALAQAKDHANEPARFAGPANRI